MWDCPMWPLWGRVQGYDVFHSMLCLFLMILFKDLLLISISQAVELWLADKAVLPIENSVGGSIHRNYDLLLRHRLHIAGEVQLIVNHCLLGLPGVRKEELKRVLSHPQVIIYSISLPHLHAKPRSTLLLWVWVLRDTVVMLPFACYIFNIFQSLGVIK